MKIIEDIKNKLKNENKKKIIYPEATDKRILEAVSLIKKENIIIPVLVGDEDEIKKTSKELNIDIDGIEIKDIKKYDKSEILKIYQEIRKGKEDIKMLEQNLEKENYFATLLLKKGEVDGLVCGAVYTTAETVRPALQIIKMKEGIKKLTGAMLMLKGEKKYIFSDIAINLTQEADELAQNAIISAKTAKIFGIDPKIAMLSYSTKGSAEGEVAKKVSDSVNIAKQLDKELKIDGDLQFDAAIVEEVGKQKAPNSEVAGKANVFIFPDLQSGNIGYKIAQRLGNMQAIGPILQGLQKPVSDLSRGCSSDDIVKLSYITAMQATL